MIQTSLFPPSWVGSWALFLTNGEQVNLPFLLAKPIVREYLDVINRPKFKISTTEITAITDYLLKTAEFVTPIETISVIEADPSDNKFLEAALVGKAICIVSGDSHLLQLESFWDIKILTAYDFMVLLNSL